MKINNEDRKYAMYTALITAGLVAFWLGVIILIILL